MEFTKNVKETFSYTRYHFQYTLLLKIQFHVEKWKAKIAVYDTKTRHKKMIDGEISIALIRSSVIAIHSIVVIYLSTRAAPLDRRSRIHIDIKKYNNGINK